MGDTSQTKQLAYLSPAAALADTHPVCTETIVPEVNSGDPDIFIFFFLLRHCLLNYLTRGFT